MAKHKHLLCVHWKAAYCRSVKEPLIIDIQWERHLLIHDWIAEAYKSYICLLATDLMTEVYLCMSLGELEPYTTVRPCNRDLSR